MNKEIKNVIIYCRVSTDEQAQYGTSLDFQENRLKEYCRNNNYNIIGQPYREDYSAKTFNKRPEIKKMMEFCRKHKNEVDIILFYSWDRYSRSLEYALTNIRQLKRLNIEVNSISNPLDHKSTDFNMMLGVYVGSAESENNKISNRTKNGIHENLEKGRWPNRAPIGYKNIKIDEKNKYVIINEKKAEIVQEIFKQVAKGTETPNNIRIQFERKGHKINKTAFMRMLRNHFYIGKVRVPEFEDTANNRIIPVHFVEGVHEAIIEKETFYKVQDIIDGRKKYTPKLSKKIHPDLFLRKYLACPTCGASLTGAGSRGNGGTYYYYNCSKDAKHFRCRADEANEKFAQYTATLKPKDEVLELYEMILKDLGDKKKDDTKKEIEKLEIEIENINKKIDSLDDKYLLNEIEKAMYDRMQERFAKEKKTAEEKIEFIKYSNQTDIEPRLNYSINLISNIPHYLREGKVEVKCKIIGSMFPEKVVFDGKSYRTNSYNSVLDLIYQQTNELRVIKEESGKGISTFSTSVPRAGIEPAWK